MPKRDPHFPEPEFESLAYAMQSAWQTRIHAGAKEALAFVKRSHGTSRPEDIEKIVRALGSHVRGAALAQGFRSTLNAATVQAYQRGKREVNAESAAQTKSVRRDAFSVEVVDGMGEFDAIRALEDQVMIAAGSFFDDRLQQSLTNELSSWYSGDLSYDELATKLQDLVNERLVSDGKPTLGDVYFRQLAHHSIVRTRSVSKFARAKELGATGYKLINPMDARTSVICKTLVRRGTVYSLSKAQGVVDDLLGAKSTADLKATQPFWKSPDEDRLPFPPLHWGECRTTIRIVFK
jgi:hypothetical protein